MTKYDGEGTTGKPADMKIEKLENGSVLFRVAEHYESGKSGQHPVILTKVKVKQLIADLVSML